MADNRAQHDTEKNYYINQDISAIEIERAATCKDNVDAHFDDLDLRNTLASKADDSDGKSTWSFRKMLAAISLAGFYVGGAIPTLLIGASLQYIAVDLHAEFASWLITANTLAVAASTPFVGYLTDLVGPRYIILSGSAMLIVGMAVVGSAHSFGQAIAGMAITGIGCGICEVNALAGISELAPVRLRAAYLGFITFGVSFFTPYPFYTQFICRDASWRWVTWIILIWVGVWWIVCAFTYFPDSRRNRIQGMTKVEVLKRLDWIGAASSITGVALILVALQDGGYRYPWASAHVIATLIIGILTFAGFVLWEGWFAPHPMVPKVLLKEKAVVIPLTLAFSAGVTYFALLGFNGLLVQKLYYTKSPLEIGVLSQGFSVGLLLGSALPNISLSYTRGYVRWPILFCILLMTGFTGSLMHSNPTNPAFTAAMASFAAFGIGGVLVPSATVALTCCPDSLIGTVAGLAMSVRTLGGAIGITIYSAVYQNKLGTYLPENVAKYAIKAGLPASSAPAFVDAFLTAGANASTIPRVTAEILAQAALGEAWGNSYALRYVWITSVAFGGVACVICLFVPNTRKYMTNRIAVDYVEGHTVPATKNVEARSVDE